LSNNFFIPALTIALFAGSDILAYGCIKAIKEKSLSIPDDVSIVGFGDLPLGDVMDTSLTTIRVPKREMGELAMDIVIKRIEGDIERPPLKILIGSQFIERGSVKDLTR
jgi:LacI family transcriptional regulator